MNPSGGFSAFISYASEDGEKAHDVCRHLEQRRIPCWIAPRNVRAGHEYADEIVTGIERSACTIVLLSRAANKSPFVSREVERAVSNHKPIFPVRLEEVLPDAGLELFLSGTHWLDVWEGNWDDHMRRLARGVAELTTGVAAQPARPPRERRLRVDYAVALLVLALAAGGFARWTFSAGRSQTPPSEIVPSATQPPTEPVVPPSPRVGVDSQSSAAVEGRPELPVAAGGDVGPAAAREAPGLRSQPSQPTTAAPRAEAVQGSAELDALRDDYDSLSTRGDVLDDTLNRLWEEMRPLAPRVDIATRQRSLQTALQRARNALDNRDAAAARKYLDTARADAAALDEFLGR